MSVRVWVFLLNFTFDAPSWPTARTKGRECARRKDSPAVTSTARPSSTSTETSAGEAIPGSSTRNTYEPSSRVDA